MGENRLLQYSKWDLSKENAWVEFWRRDLEETGEAGRILVRSTGKDGEKDQVLGKEESGNNELTAMKPSCCEVRQKDDDNYKVLRSLGEEYKHKTLEIKDLWKITQEC